jgi:hypothetical protein
MRNALLVLIGVAALPWTLSCGSGTPAAAAEHAPLWGAAAGRPGPPPAAPGAKVEVPPPPFSDGAFPCSECHTAEDLPPNPTRRILEDAHDEIVLAHDEDQRWCLDCHDRDDRDQLHLASGEPVPFEESYRLCGQCHGEKHRDWRAGVHGRRVGEWNGPKQYLLCVHCHSPHEPRFKAIAPEAAPLRPLRSGGRQAAH